MILLTSYPVTVQPPMILLYTFLEENSKFYYITKCSVNIYITYCNYNYKRDSPNIEAIRKDLPKLQTLNYMLFMNWFLNNIVDELLSEEIILIYKK